MDILSINNNYYNVIMQSTVGNMSVGKLTDSVKKAENSESDEELMNACKSFEAYMVEQVMAKMEEVSKIEGVDSEDDNEYMSMFKDVFIKERAEMLTENTDLGIAKMLYESMKRNVVTPTDSANALSE